VASAFARAALEKGATAAIEEFDSALKSGAIPEDSVNSLAYRLQNKRKADSIRLFQLNVELHPQSSDAYDNIAGAYMEIGDKVQAAKNYEKSLELDPKNRNAAAKLKELKVGPAGQQ
jgi:tetratricopeptide (TPR) repeat protein